MSPNNIAIKAENISKVYRLGLKEQQHDSMLAAAIDMAKSPFRNFRRYRSLYKFSAQEMAEKGAAQEDLLWALKDISFTVPGGEVLGIIGHNGAGKSTLLKVLSRITHPTGGRVRIWGRVSSLLEVGTGFHPELTGRENIYLNGTILGMRKEEVKRKFDDIVAFSGVEKFLDTPVKRYSSGMRVRLAFSVAAHLEPEILIIDEVLAVGDADFQNKCLGKMENITKAGRTVLFVSHNMGAVARLCKNALLIEEGCVSMRGSAAQVVNAYLSSGQHGAGVREWRDADKRPGGEVAQLCAIRVKNQQGEVVEAIDIRECVGIEMEFEVIVGGRRLMPHLHFFDQQNNHLFMSMDVDPKWRGRERPVGRFKSTAWVQGNFFNAGRILVTPACGTLAPRVNQFYEKDAVGFEVIDNGNGDGARGDWGGKIGGLVRPLLDWQTEYQSN
jgi:lipopolysaccharide transport system ATP-binding protein